MITKYELMLDRSGNNHPYLVQEASVDYSAESLNSPNQIADMLQTCFHLGERAEEILVLLVFDSAGHPLGVFELAHGTVREALVGVREIFVRTLLCGGVSFALAHNHPSGCVQPSKEDFEVSRKVQEASKIMGVPILDFIIIGNGSFLSFSRDNLI